MLSITIPMWVLFAVAGLPTMILLALSIRLMRIKRFRNRLQAEQAQGNSPGMSDGFDKQMNQVILEQQIDTVFNAMLTILESEQIKLKALVRQVQPGPAAFRFTEAQTRAMSHNDPPEQISPRQRTEEAPPSVAEMVNEGSRPEDISRRLGLSQTEVALAMKLHAGRRTGRGQRLEAVA